jgi:hypothetical protein
VRRSLIALSVLFLLASAPAAQAGGFATAGLSSTPDGVAAGSPWVVDVTLLQHGVRPLEGVQPAVRISAGGEQRDFPAAPTGEPGVYRAKVVFPEAGEWRYEVLDGFIDQPHTFPSVQVAATTAADDGPAPGWLAGAGLALVAAVALMLVGSRRREPQVA